MPNILDIGMSSLLAYKSALAVASNNIANATTEGYSRRVVQFAEFNTGYGVNVADIKRVVDEQASQYARTSNSQFAQMDVYLQQLQQMEPLLSGNAATLGKSITDSLTALRDLNAAPNLGQNRSLYLSKLSTLSQQFQSLNGELIQQDDNAVQSIQAVVTQVNSILANLANINQHITVAEGESANVLADQRDALLQQLSTYLNFTTQDAGMGQVNVVLDNGIGLVLSDQAYNLTTITDPSGTGKLLYGVSSSAGVVNVTQAISGGQLVGLENFRSVVAQTTRNMSSLAMCFSNALNQQNQVGLDGYGQYGNVIFNDINSAAMMQGRSIPYLSNTGSGPISVAVTGMQQLTSSDYKFVMGSSNSYTLTRKSDNTVVSSGTLSSTFPQTISADGFSMTLSSGTYLAGDQYTISPTANGISNFRVAITDPNKLALAFPVTANANTNNKGTGTASVTSISNIKNSVFSQSGALNPPLSIQFASLSGNLVYNIVNATTGAVIEANIPYNATTGAKVFPTPGGYDPGYCVQLSGSINAGDSFNLVFNSQYATDNRNGLAMAGLYSQQILQNGSLTFTQAYDSLSLYVSEKTNSATQQNHEAKAIKDDADQKRDQISGVSVEEETMNLGEYQQVYQASAQVLQVARTMFDSIMRILEG